MTTITPDATSKTSGDRALVLGGGGSAGNAWLIGIVAGLLEGGLDVREADLIIGTSAGSTAAAQITGASPAQLLAETLAAVPPQRPRPAAPTDGRAPVNPMAEHMRRLQELIAASKDLADMRRRLGAAALKTSAQSDGSQAAQWRATVAARLPNQDWPEQLVRITAVDAHTGAPVEFDRHSGVDLVDAVAASCAGGGLAYDIAGRQYIDGGYRRSSENADLAAGYNRVLVLSPLSGKTLHPTEWGSELSVQVDELRAGGSRVETIVPDAASLEAFGTNMMNLSTRPPAAQAGYSQGQALAARLADFWR